MGLVLSFHCLSPLIITIPNFAPIYFGEGGQEKSTGLQPGPRSLELRGTLVIKYSRFFVAVNILFNQINIVHNAMLYTIALFSRVMRLYKPMDTGVSEVFEVGEKYFFVCGLGWASL